MIHIRPATPTDIDAIVRIHISSWIAQFTPFLSAEQVQLKELDETVQASLWQARLSSEEDVSRKTFVAHEGKDVIAYITGHISDNLADIKLHQIYVQSDKQHLGVGRQLVAQLAHHYHQLGKKSLFVWVMTINPAVAFYRDTLGGTYITERLIPDGDGILKEAAYRWQSLEVLF